MLFLRGARSLLLWAKERFMPQHDDAQIYTALSTPKSGKFKTDRFAWLRTRRVLCGIAGLVCLALIVVGVSRGILDRGISGSSLKVDLGYGKYTGVARPNNISQWLGIRYAAPPLGDLRFRAPQDPLMEKGETLADEHGAVCIPSDGGNFPRGTSEDCLVLDVFAPTAISKPAQLLPVYVFIQGGGFNANSNANFMGSGLVAASNHSIVVVTFNYRVGPYGFLTSKEVEADGDLNVGLKDQRKVFEWVQKHISKFGGDPNHITIGGDSAGAASINLHLTAYGGRNDGLFHAAAAESPSFGAQFTINESQYQYDALVQRTGCNTADDTLRCLRELDVNELQAKNINIATPGSGKPLFMYSNVIDGNFTEDYTYIMFNQGKFVKVPVIYGADTNDGTIFVPKSTPDVTKMNTFLKNQFPHLTEIQLSTIDTFYPEVDHFAGKGDFWRAAANAYGDMRYLCPGLFLSDIYANASLPSWNYRYNVQDPYHAAQGLGVPHTVETSAIWGPENVNGAAPASYSEPLNAPAVTLMQAYWTSFIVSYDPNKHRAPGAPLWQQWSSGSRERIRLETNTTAMERVDNDQYSKCLYFNEIGVSLQQ